MAEGRKTTAGGRRRKEAAYPTYLLGSPYNESLCLYGGGRRRRNRKVGRKAPPPPPPLSFFQLYLLSSSDLVLHAGRGGGRIRFCSLACVLDPNSAMGRKKEGTRGKVYLLAAVHGRAIPLPQVVLPPPSPHGIQNARIAHLHDRLTRRGIRKCGLDGVKKIFVLPDKRLNPRCLDVDLQFLRMVLIRRPN